MSTFCWRQPHRYVTWKATMPCWHRLLQHNSGTRQSPSSTKCNLEDPQQTTRFARMIPWFMVLERHEKRNGLAMECERETLSNVKHTTLMLLYIIFLSLYNKMFAMFCCGTLIVLGKKVGNLLFITRSSVVESWLGMLQSTLWSQCQSRRCNFASRQGFEGLGQGCFAAASKVTPGRWWANMTNTWTHEHRNYHIQTAMSLLQIYP